MQRKMLCVKNSPLKEKEMGISVFEFRKKIDYILVNKNSILRDLHYNIIQCRTLPLIDEGKD